MVSVRILLFAPQQSFRQRATCGTLKILCHSHLILIRTYALHCTVVKLFNAIRAAQTTTSDDLEAASALAAGKSSTSASKRAPNALGGKEAARECRVTNFASSRFASRDPPKKKVLIANAYRPSNSYEP